MTLITCHSCKTQIDVLMPLGFRVTCDHCSADLHVCLQCRHHDRSYSNECRETQAEPVRDRDRSNRCDWFALNETPCASAQLSQADEAKRKLEELFKK